MAAQRFVLISSFLLLANLWSSSVEAVRTTYVYRGASRSPEEIQAAGGFLPKGLTTPGVVAPDVSLFNHIKGIEDVNRDGTIFYWDIVEDDDGYVALTRTWSAALDFALRRARVSYIYKVHVTPNMIDAKETLGKYCDLYARESEYSALGGVKWDQIVSWYTVNETSLHGGTLSWLWPTPNPDYNEKRYRGFTSGGAQYQLAGFPPDHPAWEEEPWARYKPCLDKENKHGDDGNSKTRPKACKRPKSAYQVALEYMGDDPSVIEGWYD